MTSPGVRVPLEEEEMLPIRVPDNLRKIVGKINTIDAYQYCTQSNSKGTLNKRVLTITTHTNPPTLFLSKEDDTLTRVVPLVNIASAFFRRGKRGENITLLNMKPDAKEPGLLFMDTFDARNNQANIGKHHIVRVINYLKNQINGTDLPLYDVSNTNIDLFKQNSLKRPTGYVPPDVKLQQYRNARTGSPFLRRQFKKEEPEREKTPPPIIYEPPVKVKPVKQKKETPVSPKTDRQALQHFLNYYLSSIPSKGPDFVPRRREVMDPPYRPPSEDEYVEPPTVAFRKPRHVMRERGEPPSPVYATRPVIPMSDMGVQTAILSEEGNRIDASSEELPADCVTPLPESPLPKQFTPNPTPSSNLLLNFDLPVTCFVRPSSTDPSKVRMTC